MQRQKIQTGRLYVVATPIGNLEDISHRACKILASVNWVAAEDTRHSQGLLHHLGINTPLVSYHAHNEPARAEELITKLCSGESGALISDAGTPLISDPGYTLVARAHEMGIPVIPIPGASAFVCALSASGLPTHRFMFEGFLPAKSTARQERLRALSGLRETLVFLEAPHRMRDLIQDAITCLGAQRRVSIARELTKKFEEIRLNSLEKALTDLESGAMPCKGEFVVIIEGVEATLPEVGAEEAQMQRVLEILLESCTVKQAVQLAVRLTGLPKNKLYDFATKMANISDSSI